MKNYMCLCIFMLIICIVTPPVTSEVFTNRSANSGSCTLPPYPDHGTYTVAKLPNARPGDTLDSFILTVSCRRGFGVVDTNATDWDGYQLVYCVNSEWSQTMPECVRFCKLNPHPSVTYTCHTPRGGLKKCKNYVAPGTLVNPACNSPIYHSTEVLPNMKCTFGFFDYVAKCKAECGLVTPEGVQLVINGTSAMRGELPWHVGIYRKTTRPYMQICGGSIISNNVVISAGHCFWTDFKKLHPASEFAVAIGKIHRPWDHENDIGAQKSDVKEIRVPTLFRGQATNFQEDIAVLILATPFLYQTHIRPVCLSYDVKFDNFQLRHGKLGKVAGWGLTAANGKPSSVLKVVNMPFINEETCYKSFPQSFSEYFTSDKFCAGYTNGTTLCHGDSGGGLAFPQEELDIYRYYLRGVVSTAPRNDNKLCNDKSYTTFTRITKHQEFIIEAEAASAEKTCPLYSFQCADGTCVNPLADCNGKRDCPDGSDEADELCNPEAITESESRKPTCVLPRHPDYGTYEVANVSNASPGQSFESFTLTVLCNNGFKFENGNEIVHCDKGVWKQKMPTCDSFCILEEHPSVTYMCLVSDTNDLNNLVPCSKYVQDGTSVKPTCNAPSYYSPFDLPFMACIRGSWTNVIRCHAECGQLPPDEKPLVLDGRSPHKERLPWHVVVYRQASDSFEPHCGGSIVTNNKVISAADCFWDYVLLQLAPSDFMVVAGKIYGDWDDVRDKYTQKSQINEIKIPEGFRGREVSYSDDISILTLTTPFVFNTYVRPVCINFMLSLRDSTIGKVTSWGFRSANETANPVSTVYEMSYVHVQACFGITSSSFLDYIASDIFCAEYTNGTGLCKHDNGAGLAFPVITAGVERYYLRGIPSSLYYRSREDCDDSDYIIFSDINKNKKFIAENL